MWPKRLTAKSSLGQGVGSRGQVSGGNWLVWSWKFLGSNPDSAGPQANRFFVLSFSVCK